MVSEKQTVFMAAHVYLRCIREHEPAVFYIYFMCLLHSKLLLSAYEIRSDLTVTYFSKTTRSEV